jgi:NitT/TauT family transport system permease protein
MVDSAIRTIKFRDWLTSALAVVAVLVAWEYAGQRGVSVFLPPFSAVATSWVRIARSGVLWTALQPSLYALAQGFALALLVGVVMGIFMGRFMWVDAALSPYMNSLMSAPLSALVPLLIAIFGIRDTVVTATIFIFSVFPVAVNTSTGVKGIRPSILEMARVFGAGELDLAVKIALPAALPSTLVGVRLGAIQAVKGMVIGQMLVSVSGIGERLIYYGNTFQVSELYAFVLTVLALSVLLAQCVLWIERGLVRWKPLDLVV